MPVPLGLEGGWILVTGGTAGVGRACVAEAVRAGANVAFFSRAKDRADAVAREEAGKPGRALGFACDVASLASVEGAFRELLAATGGRLDAVVHTATYPVKNDMWTTPLHEMTGAQLERWFHEVAAIDLAGSRFVTREALRAMMPRRRGSFVFFSSTPALVGYKGSPYTEAKAAVLGMMRDVAKEYAQHGIRANAIAPGNIRTGWLDDLTPEEVRALELEAPLRRFGEPAEVAKVALFLASDLASFVTGQTLIVDGGTEMR